MPPLARIVRTHACFGATDPRANMNQEDFAKGCSKHGKRDGNDARHP